MPPVPSNRNRPAPPSKDPREFPKMILTTSKDEVYLQCPHLTAHAKKAADFTATQMHMATPNG